MFIFILLFTVFILYRGAVLSVHCASNKVKWNYMTSLLGVGKLGKFIEVQNSHSFNSVIMADLEMTECLKVSKEYINLVPDFIENTRMSLVLLGIASGDKNESWMD